MNRQKKFLATIFIALCLLVTCFTSANAKGVDSAVENATENGVENELNDETDLQESIYKADLDKYLTGEGITLIGDSIANGNRQIILNQLPGLYIDAKGSRDVCGGFEAAQKLQQEGKLSDIVIVELGTNPFLSTSKRLNANNNLLSNSSIFILFCLHIEVKSSKSNKSF